MKRMLLHSCCGPCSTAVIEQLKDDYELTIFYYNPNIDCIEEYNHRLSEQKRYCSLANINVIEEGYNSEDFYSKVKGLEKEREGGARCPVCFKLRLERTAERAKKDGYDCFGTTLTVSPHKNAEIINSIGKAVEKEKGIEFIEGNYKKKDGFKKSIELSKKYNLYRQNYCGCVFSKNWSKDEEAKI